MSIVILACITYLAIYFYYINKDKKVNTSLQNEIDSIAEAEKVFEEDTTEGNKVNKIKELQKENSDIKGWIKIEGTKINYPLLQTTDNEFYLSHNYKKEKNITGSIFINKNSNIKDENANVIIYGHQMDNGEMFGDLHSYMEKSFFDKHQTINVCTEDGEANYQIVYVFKSRVFYKDEKNVFRYYNYYNFENEKEYNEYINNCEKIQLYDTGNNAKYGEQLLTLITCEYSRENGRLVVVAKKVNVQP